MIAAVAENDRAIGFQNRLLWHLPEDLAHFKKTTLGHPVIMGENTFVSLGRPLPGRKNIVLTLDKEKVFDGAFMAHDLEQALRMAAEEDTDEIFIIGGATIYKAMLPYADRLYLTLVPGTFEADTFFPEFDDWVKVISESETETKLGTIRFVTLEKE